MGDVCPLLIKDAFIYGVFESSTGRAKYWPRIETLLDYLRTGISSVCFPKDMGLTTMKTSLQWCGVV
jgi:hypothetical protein